MPTFTDFILHGLTWTPSGEPYPARLKRNLSFPTLLYTSYFGERLPPQGDLAPRPLPTNGNDFTLELEARVVVGSEEHPTQCSDKKSLGNGRSGWVFPLEVICVRAIHLRDDTKESPSFDELFRPGYTVQCDGTTTTAVGMPKWNVPPLCVKIARPVYSRNIAREAWFYERLDNAKLTGLVAPTCFGIFHGVLGAHPESIRSMYDSDNSSDSDSDDVGALSLPSRIVETRIPGHDFKEVHQEQFWQHYPDCRAYIQDGDSDPDGHVDDPNSSYATSPWLSYREDPMVAMMTAIVLEQVGRPATCADLDADPEDFYQIIKDVGWALIWHQDIRWKNFLKAPPSYAKVCPRHNRIHRWLLCDWEDAWFGTENLRSTFASQGYALQDLREDMPDARAGKSFKFHEEWWS